MAVLRNLLLLFMIFSQGNAFLDEFCPEGWTNFELRCFKFFYESVDWLTAERNCQSLDANLASVHSKTENDFLMSMLPSSRTLCWIGAHDGVKEGQWMWSDGSVYKHTNWCSGEPNNHEIENCLELNWFSRSCWNDAPCSKKKSYMCAKNLW